MLISFCEMKFLLDFPKELLCPAFYSFACEGTPDVIVQLGSTGDLADKPGITPHRIKGEALSVLLEPGRYRMLRYNEPAWQGVSVEAESSVPRILCVPTEGYTLSSADAFSLMCVMRSGVFYLLQQHKIYVLHSSSIVWHDKVYAFSAISGTGKTTHTDLWVKEYQTPVFNGDVLAIRAGELPVCAYGIPWSGSSGKYMAGKIPLGGVFFLVRDTKSNAEQLSDFNKLIRLSLGMFAINYTPDLLREIVKNLENTAQALPCAILHCTPDMEAVQAARTYIQNYME